MRGEKRLGAIGIGLFFLFPLVGLFQLGDADDAWRQVAKRARPAVLCVHSTPTSEREASTATDCAVVLATAPLRAVIVGPAPSETLQSPAPGGWIAWTPIHSDPQGTFTILEARSNLDAGAALATGLGSPATTTLARGALTAATMAGLGASGDEGESVPAVLVPPSPFDELPLWVGLLEAGRSPGGRSVLRGRDLRAVDSGAGQVAASATGTPDIHPALRGAPFVTREGAVVGLYSGIQNGTPMAVPIDRVLEAIDGLTVGSRR